MIQIQIYAPGYIASISTKAKLKPLARSTIKSKASQIHKTALKKIVLNVLQRFCALWHSSIVSFLLFNFIVFPFLLMKNFETEEPSHIRTLGSADHNYYDLWFGRKADIPPASTKNLQTSF